MGIIQKHWNRVVANDWPPKKRNYVRASELGMPFLDRWLSMNGEPITNPFPDRVQRIFQAGHVIEFIVMRTLAMAGILNRNQDYINFPATKDTLEVKGRLDATIGGFTNWDEALKNARANLDKYKLDLDDEVLESKSAAIVEGLRAEYPNGFQEEMLVEVKSISSMAFWKSKENRDEEGNFKGYDHNRLQMYAYLKGTGIHQGILLYVSKDDFTLEEVVIQNGDEEMERALAMDLHVITDYWRRNEPPPRESEIIFNSRKGAFEINWAVERSLYLTKSYGYKDQDELYGKNHQLLLDINRALRHLKKGKIKPEDEPLINEYNLDWYKDVEVSEGEGEAE
jgi:hypothetical protein